MQPQCGHKAGLDAFVENDGHIIEGILRDDAGCWYPIVEGVPCFLRGELQPDFEWFRRKYHLGETANLHSGPTDNKQQALTNKTFSDKWSRFKHYGLEPGHEKFLFEWYCKKLNVSDIDALKQFYRQRHNVLEVGSGSGFNTQFIAQNTSGDVIALDISDAAFTTFQNTRHLPNCHVVQADLMDAPLRDQSFDLIVADGVLHHTPDTKKAVFALFEKVRPGGQFFFYVYKQMGAAKRFCDEFIRSEFTKLSPEACYAACEGFTELGRELSNLNARITLEKGVPILGIPPGEHNVQRLLYYNFVKCFWNDAFDFETNNMVNFDWYHPHNAWQHTEEEIEGWMAELAVRDFRFNASNPNGISVLLTR
ncbi:MAG: class I SAM-dependent methyltransferase [Burkholderiales bacterium]